MNSYQYVKNSNIHIVNYTGEINLEEGLLRLEELGSQLCPFISDRVPIKLLIDFRSTVWKNIETHNALTKLARQRFDAILKNIPYYVAVLNSQYNCPTFDNEYWFTNEDEAFNWLEQQSI